jgi:hypothetical protein
MILMALTPMGMTAAFNLPALGNTSILAYDLLLLTLTSMIVLRRGGTTDLLSAFRPGGPGVFLILFLLYAAICTIFMPRVFAGETEVFSIGRVANQIGIISRPLRPGTGNLSQLIRMILSILGFAAAAAVVLRRPDTRLVVRVMTVATAVHVSAGLLDLATQATGTAWLLAPLRTANYALTIGQNLGGLNRMIGGMPESSTYGYYSMGMFGFWLSYWYSNRSASYWPLVWLLLTAFVVLRSTSSSAYVAFAGLMLVFIASRLGRAGGQVSRQTAYLLVGSVLIAPLLIFVAYTLYELVPAVSGFVDRSLLNKLSSDSGVERMSWNRQALINFADTLALGAGLGSVRASNLIAALLGSTGLIGTGLFLAFLWRLFRNRPAAQAPYEMRATIAALQMGCAGFVMRALVVQGTPNLHIVFFALAGLSAGLVVASRREARATKHTPQPTQYGQVPPRLSSQQPAGL